MTIGSEPDCLRCAHFETYHREELAGVSNKYCCLAYTNGIPDDIFLAGTKHNKPRSDQEGDFVFQKVKS
jgi:hypothetical protein